MVNEEVSVAVRDDGKGVPRSVAEFRPGSGGVGVGGMRQRVKEFGGELRLLNANPGALVEAVFRYKSAGVALSTAAPLPPI
jgi:signal transduction histidine kinase